MSDETLLPCPFCGGDADVRFVTGEARHFWAGCWDHCGVYASRYAKAGSADADARIAAITAWNTRTPSPDNGERMRDAIKLTIADASYHLAKYRPHCLEALRAALRESAR